jgi:signal transduction histidine kinase
MLRASEAPVAPAGEVFRWSVGEPAPESLLWRAASPEEGAKILAEFAGVPEVAPGVRLIAGESSVFETLLVEARRRELVDHDLAGAMELVLEALAKDPENERRSEGWLRALQLGARLERDDVVRSNWERLRTAALFECHDSVPYRWLAWMALPEELRNATPSAAFVGSAELERFAFEEDGLVLGPPDEPEARFELASIVVAVCERMGVALPPLERRKTRALSRVGTLPEIPEDGRWHLELLAGRPFVARRAENEITGSFYVPRALEDALAEHSARPTGFRLDFDGDREELGPAVRPRTDLPQSTLAFTLRHEDPARLGQAESARLKLLRGALLALALACAAGGFLTARVLARERKLGELKSAFVAGVSHDLRTPLASILLLAENLEAGVVGDADRARYHRSLRKETTRLRRLIDDVLDFSRLARGEAPRLEREELDLGRFADELAADLRQRVEDAGRTFLCERGALPQSAVLDAFAVRRALENLVENALKHGAGAVRLAFACADGRLCVTVADEGPGVPAAERERVFEPFERLNGAGHVGGTGLGLAIVRAIARGHGGEARVRPGPGTVFEIELPLVEAEA